MTPEKIVVASDVTEDNLFDNNLVVKNKKSRKSKRNMIQLRHDDVSGMTQTLTLSRISCQFRDNKTDLIIEKDSILAEFEDDIKCLNSIGNQIADVKTHAKKSNIDQTKKSKQKSYQISLTKNAEKQINKRKQSTQTEKKLVSNKSSKGIQRNLKSKSQRKTFSRFVMQTFLIRKMTHLRFIAPKM